MKQPRRIIFYLMDGISGTKVRSFNSKKYNDKMNKRVKKNFLDLMAKKSFTFTKVYGHDSTLGSMLPIISGQTHNESRISGVQHFKHLGIKQSLINTLKSEGYYTSFFTNNYVNNLAIPIGDFDEVQQIPHVYDYKKTKLSKKFWGLNGKKTFLFLHDFYTHDQNGQYVFGKHGLTTKEYEQLIEDHAKKTEANLKYLNFDSKKDLLILFSDHGLTLDVNYSPKGGGFDNSQRIKMWSFPSKEIKSRLFFMTNYHDIKPAVNSKYMTIEKAFSEIIALLKIPYASKTLQKENNEVFCPSRGITPTNPFRIFEMMVRQDIFYQFMYLKEGKKWIYQTNMNFGEYYDLNKDELEKNPKQINYEQLPERMKELIKKYKKGRLSWFKYLPIYLDDKKMKKYYKKITIEARSKLGKTRPK